MIKRLQVKGFKSLYDLDVTFSPLTVLFGANTSGKSNVLDVIQLLARSATAEHIVDVFSPPFRGSGFSCFSLGEDAKYNKNGKIEIVVDLTLSPKILSEAENDFLGDGTDSIVYSMAEGVDCRYSLTLEVSEIGSLTISHEALFFSQDTGITDGFSGSGNFTTILSKKNGKSVYVRAVQKELASWRVFSLDPQDGLRAMNEEFRQNATLGPKGEYLASFLYALKIQNPKQWETFQKALHLYIPEITAVDVLLNQHGEVELFVIEDGKRISIRLMSDGTLTLLGLAAIGCIQHAGVIGIDEPENGIYPTRLDLIGRFLEFQADENRQLIVATHSPVLMDYLPLDSLYMCQKKSGKTTIVPLKTLPGMSYVSDDISLSDVLVSGLFNG